MTRTSPTRRTRHRTARTRPGTPTSWGRPGAGAARIFDTRGRIGATGETSVAALLAQADLPAGTMIFHDVVPPGGEGNIDHVVLRGDTMVVIDSKRWKPGQYRTVQEPTSRDRWDQRTRSWVRDHGTRAVTYRDGTRFEPGDITSFRFLTAELLDATRWRGRTVPTLVISASHGPDSDLDLSGYTPAGANVTTLSELVPVLAATLRRSRPVPVTATVHRLLRLCTDHTMVATPYPSALTGPVGTPRFLDDRPRTSWPLKVTGFGAGAATVALGVVPVWLGHSPNPATSTVLAATGLGFAAMISRGGHETHPMLGVMETELRVPATAGRGRTRTIGKVVATSGVLAAVLPHLAEFLDRFPLLDSHSGPLRDLHVTGQVLAAAVTIVGVCTGISVWGHSQSFTGPVRWARIVESAHHVPPWVIPVLAQRMGEQSDSDRWFSEITALSRSSAWRTFAEEATRQAIR